MLLFLLYVLLSLVPSDHHADNQLKGMIAKFVNFMGLTSTSNTHPVRTSLTPVLAFTGICFTLWTLGRGTWTIKQIVWLMMQVLRGFHIFQEGEANVLGKYS